MHFPLNRKEVVLSSAEQQLNQKLAAAGLSLITKPLPTESMEACMHYVKQEHPDWSQKQRVAACLNATGQSNKMHFPNKEAMTSNAVGAYNATSKPVKQRKKALVLEEDLETIKQEAMRHPTEPLFFEIDGREAVVFPSKYDHKWWQRATVNDVRRIAVY